MHTLRRTLLVLALAALPATVEARQVPPDHTRQVDEIFSAWDSHTSPGCAVAVAKGGLNVLERAYGMADLEHGVPNTPRTIFEGGSVSKQFTAAAVVLLALDGALSLEDDVRRYVPELPDYGHTITLKHLLTHTSGLRDWGSVASISGWGREQREHTHDWVVDILSRQSALNFVPGHQYSYSNSGYNLLAVVVTRVSGTPFAEFSRKRIFEPLGLHDTQWRDDHRRIVPGRSSAYGFSGDGRWEINRPVEDVHGNGGILTTVGDLVTWTEALAEGRLGGPDFVRLMHEVGTLNDGSRITYASGLTVSDFRGVPSVTHTGSTAGYRAFVGRYPEQELIVAMLCNAGNVSTGGNGGRVASVYLGDAMVDPVEPEGIELPAAALERLAGLYADPVTGDTRTLRYSDGSLWTGRTRLVPLSPTRFQHGARDVFFDFQEGGAGRPGFLVDAWEFSHERYEPVAPWTPTAPELEAMVGTYHSDDAETSFRVYLEAGRLRVWRRPGATWTLEPLYPNAFSMQGRIVRFHRRGDAPAHELSLSQGRVFDMRFRRVER